MPQNIDADLITVNNFFARLIKKISVTKYGSDIELVPTFAPYETYQYTDSMLKHLPEKAIKTIEKTHLYSKKPIYYTDVNIDRRIHSGDRITAPTRSTAAQIANLKANYAKDLNIDDCIAKFKNLLKNELVYRIPLRSFTDLVKE